MNVFTASIFSYGFMQNAFIAGGLIGLILPLIGLLVYLKKMSFIADALGHINMAGVAFVAFLGSLIPINASFGYFISIGFTILGAILIELLRDKFKNYKEVSIMIVYSLSVCLTIIFLNLSGGYNNSLFNILFGNINAISQIQVMVIFVLTIVIICCFLVFYKQLILFSIEEEDIKLYGFNVGLIRYTTVVLITLAISLAIQVVGVLLVSSLLLIPLLCSINVAKNLKQTIIMSIVFTQIAILFGIFIAFYINLASSAVIVLLALFMYVITSFIKK